MPLQIPSRSEVVSSLQAFTRTNIPELDPTVTRRRGFIGGMVKSLGSALHDWYVRLKKYADREPFPQTATEGFFSQGWWIDITGLTRNPAAAAAGHVVVTGEPGTILPAGTVLVSGSNSYTTDTAVTVVAQTLVGTSSAVEEIRGRFVTEAPHNIGNGQELTFSGCPYDELNGTFTVEVMDAYTLEYDLEAAITGEPFEPNPVAGGVWGNVRITATVTGVAGNLDSGAPLAIQAPPTGIDSAALLTFGGVADGSDIETLEAWRSRVLEALGTDFGMFSEDEIKIVAKTVPGVTRVFVRKPRRYIETENEVGEDTDVAPGSAVNVGVVNGVGPDGYPIEGRVRIAFLRENDADPIPSALEVAQVREKIMSLLVPAHTDPEDVEVMAPERYEVHVRFLSITPDTPGIRASIRANLRAFMAEEAEWGGVLSMEGIRCAIRAAYDPETGQRLRAYELDTPTMDIAIPVDSYPVIASVSWLGS